MPKINVPELNAELEFPDSMSSEQIAAAIRGEIARSAGRAVSQDVGRGEALLIGAGRGADRIIAGAKQLGYWATGNKEKQAELAKDQEFKAASYGALSEKFPVTTAIGEAAPYFAVPMGALGGAASATVGAGARAVPALGRVAGALGTPLADAMLTGAAVSAAQYRPEGESLLGNTTTGALGGAAGYGIGRLIGKAVTPANRHLTGAQQHAADAGEAIGMRLTPGQRTGSPVLQKIEAGLESFPPTAGPFARINDGNQSVVRKAAAKAIGENADDMGTRTIDSAFQRIEDIYSKVADKTPVSLPGSALNRIGAIESDVAGLLKQPLASHPLVDRAIGQATGGTATREELQSLASKLGKAANKEMRSAMGDRDLGIALFNVREVIDDALKSSLPKDKSMEFGDAQKQYRTLMTLLGNSKVINESSGNVSAQSLATALAKADRSGYTRGLNQSDLYNAARFSEAFPKAVNDSGTATRAFIPWLMSGGSASAGLLGGLAAGNPGMGAAIGLGAVPAANLAARAYTSPLITKYVGNQALTAAEQQALARMVSGFGPSLLTAQQ